MRCQEVGKDTESQDWETAREGENGGGPGLESPGGNPLGEKKPPLSPVLAPAKNRRKK